MSFDRQMGNHLVKTVVIAQLEALDYKPPQSPTRPDGLENPAYAAAVEIYCKDVGMFPKEILEAGMQEFRRTWTYHRWPKVAELRAYFLAEQNARREQTRLDGQEALPKPKPWEPPTEDSKARVASKLKQLKAEIAGAARGSEV